MLFVCATFCARDPGRHVVGRRVPLAFFVSQKAMGQMVNDEGGLLLSAVTTRCAEKIQSIASLF